MKVEVLGPKTDQIEDLDHYSGCQDLPDAKKRGPGPWNPQKTSQIRVFLVLGGQGGVPGPVLGLPYGPARGGPCLVSSYESL